MEFPKLNIAPKKKINIRDFSLGLNPKATAPYNSLLYTQNTVFTDEGITTRGGIRKTGAVLCSADATRANSFSLTDAVIFADGVYNRLCMQYLALGSFSYRYEFKLLSEQGNITDAGTIELPLGSNGLIRKPVSALCFSARAIKGSGVFVFLTLEVSTAEEFSFEVYELSTDLKSWILIGENEMYTPTYLLNGRGNYYYRAIESLPDPEYNEALNLLSGKCVCYFTTDGYSDGFYLPLKPNTALNNYMEVELLVNVNTTLNFTFAKNTFVSNTVKFGENNIYLTYNGGFLQVTSQASNFTAQRIYGRDNNLKVTVKHETRAQFDMKGYMTVGGYYNISEEGSQVVLTGNSKYPELVLLSAPDNPLYFPESLAVNCGRGNQKITAAAPISDKLLIFKENEIYALTGRSKGAKITKVFDSLGTKAKRSVKSDLKTVYFLGSDNKIYALSSSLILKEISAPIDEHISSVSKAKNIVATYMGEAYTLIADSMAYNLDLKRSDSSLNSPIWNIWSFTLDLEISDAFDNCGNKIFICRAANSSVINYYVADMGATDYDYYYDNSNATNSLLSMGSPIRVSVKTALYSGGGEYSKKTFTKAIFYMYSRNVASISFMNEKGDIIKSTGINIIYEGNKPKPVRLYPLVHSLRCGMELTVNGSLTLKAIQLEYYEMSE